MLLANPFTGMIINANPEGHNQYFNPDGPSGLSGRLSQEQLVSRSKTRRSNARSLAEQIGNVSRLEDLDAYGRESLLAYLSSNGVDVGKGSRFAVTPTEKIRRDIAETLGLI